MNTLEGLMSDTLAAFLRAQFIAVGLVDATLGPVIVETEWPAADEPLPPKAITIELAGEREDTHIDQDILRAVPADPEDPTGDLLVTYRAFVCKQPIQLDVWARSMPERAQLLRYLDDFLNYGTQQTLGDVLGTPVRDGPLLTLVSDPNYQGFADYTFEGPRHINEGAREFEYRAIRRGFAEAMLTVQATSPRLAVIKLEMMLSGQPANYTLEPGPDGFRITTSTV